MLNAANIMLACAVRPYGVDVSSGVERAPCVKYPVRLEALERLQTEPRIGRRYPERARHYGYSAQIVPETLVAPLKSSTGLPRIAA